MSHPPNLLGLLLAVSLPALFSAAILPTSAAAERPLHHEHQSAPITHESEAVTARDTEKPLEFEAGGVSVQLGGFVKLDLMQDFDPIGNEDQFKVNSIAVSGDANSRDGDSAHLTARATRFSTDVRVTEGPAEGLRTYVEVDFFGSGNSLRLRHGYGEWRGLLAGQTWTTFQDISARPFTLDYEGPDGEIFVRQAMIRYTDTFGDYFQWALAVEEPDSEITPPAGVTGRGRSEIPDFTGNVRFEHDVGHVQLGGVFRQLRFVSDGGAFDDTTTGYGGNLSGSLNVWQNDVIMGHVAIGRGIGRYIESFSGTNSDAVLSPTGDLDALDAWTAVLGFTHNWTDTLSSTISGSYAELDNDSSQPGSAIESAHSGHVNLVYKPFTQLMLGTELMYGERENNNGADGDAFRLQFTVQFNFR